ncbi:unnamed protein product [Rotaria socialis]|uniref:F-box domain-containing protein n=2 Tax=Rotaria socialis TaxID=392032 RepID=A0A820VLX1_9BILA|nr:unnamed protein product [Rotaria socialis]CAF3321737.1 unnamed protein product [Rotaria socialis]CAF3471345.1 unnamed protein product [Rotaria socialis]CAF4220036.1 unnamed protein product [Rotaria socialis]CAF4502086.1 unnamed protein product [Rotaria socialis]
MISRLEILPNEIFFNIFSHLSWNEILTSFWSLNERFNSLVCSTFSMNQTGIIIGQTNLSYKIFLTKLFPLISNCSSLINSIRHIHFDGSNSNSYDFFNQNENIHNYPNLESFVLNQIYLSELLIENLSLLIQYRLKELTLILDEDIFKVFRLEDKPYIMVSSQVKKRLLMFKDLLNEIFSEKCQLISLRLDIPRDHSYLNIHQCLSSSAISNTIKIQYCCMTLRYVDIRLHYACLIEHLIEHVPNLERLSVYLRESWNRNKLWDLTIGPFEESDTMPVNKKFDVKRLKYFILKCGVNYDRQLNYLKWFFNNLSNVEKMKIRLRINGVCKKSPIINESIVDANFIRKYLMSDTINNLIHFNFYIISICKFLSNYTERTINSFKIHPFFIERQWTNVKCLFDPIKFYQHLSSSPSCINNLSEYFPDLISYSDIFFWPNLKYIEANFHEKVHLYLERLNELFPNVSCIKFDMGSQTYCDNSIVPFKMEQHKLTDIHLRYVTRLDFGLYFSRGFGSNGSCDDQNKERAKILAPLISMPVQLSYLRIEQFEWLLHIIQYAFDELEENALINVRYLEFCVPSCTYGENETVLLGKNLVPFLSKYMPYLQTLCLWKRDDFPWSSMESLNGEKFSGQSPDISQKPHFYRRSGILARRWLKYLKATESINQHAARFEQDLCELVEQLKQLVYLDIHGEINDEKLESYRLMVQKRFSDAHFSIEKSRFRLWI